MFKICYLLILMSYFLFPSAQTISMQLPSSWASEACRCDPVEIAFRCCLAGALGLHSEWLLLAEVVIF